MAKRSQPNDKLAQVFGTDIESLFCLKEYLKNEE